MQAQRFRQLLIKLARIYKLLIEGRGEPWGEFVVRLCRAERFFAAIVTHIYPLALDTEKRNGIELAVTDEESAEHGAVGSA
jgi:hypothetical protein